MWKKTGKKTERGGREEGKRKLESRGEGKEREPGERHRRKLWNAPSLTADDSGKRLAGKKKMRKSEEIVPQSVAV